MKIETNIGKKTRIHDAIKYPALEKQVADLLGGFFTVTHRTESHGIVLLLDGRPCLMETYTDRLELTTSPLNDQVVFGESKGYPRTKLSFNKDVTKKLTRFAERVKKLVDIEGRGVALAKSFNRPKREVVNAELDRFFGTDAVQVSYWDREQAAFDGLPLNFYLHPKKQAPAQGVMLCIENDGTVGTFWNVSSQRRTMYGKVPTKIEEAVGELTGSLAELKVKIAQAEEVLARVQAFDLSKSKLLTQLVDDKRKATVLLDEFRQLSKGG